MKSIPKAPWTLELSLTLALSLAVVACSSQGTAPKTTVEVQETTSDLSARVAEWSRAIIKDCTVESVMMGGGKGPFLDVPVLNQRLAKSPERTIVAQFGFQHGERVEAAPWVVSGQPSGPLTAVRTKNRCLIRRDGNLMGETELATSLDIWADSGAGGNRPQFESRTRLVQSFPRVRAGHPLLETIASALRPSTSSLQFVSSLSGVSEAQLKPFIRWRAPGQEEAWGIRLRWNENGQEKSFFTSSREAWVPAEWGETSFPRRVHAEVLVPAPDARTKPTVFRYDIGVELAESSGLRAVIIDRSLASNVSADEKQGELCFILRWDALLRTASSPERSRLTAVNLEDLLAPCLPWDSRLRETVYHSDQLRPRMRELIGRGLLRDPEVRSRWSPMLLRYLKAQLDAGHDFVEILDPERKEPILTELFRTQTLLRAEVNQRPEALAASLTALEDLLFRWVLAGARLDADALSIFLLAVERVGPHLRGPFLRQMEQSPGLVLQSPEIEYALRMKTDLRAVIERSKKLALEIGWNHWTEGEFEKLFVHRRPYSQWRGQLNFLETLRQVFLESELTGQHKQLIAETVVQTYWRSTLQIEWKKGTTSDLATQLRLLSELFPQAAASWLETRKKKGLSAEDTRLLEFAKSTRPEHLTMWREVGAGATRMGVATAFERLGRAMFTGDRAAQETLVPWSNLESVRFRAWVDLVAAQSWHVIGFAARSALVTHPERWVRSARWDHSLALLSQVAMEFSRWQPETSFLEVHRELMGALVNDPDTRWGHCDQAGVLRKMQSLLQEMRNYRDHFGGAKADDALRNLRANWNDCSN